MENNNQKQAKLIQLTQRYNKIRFDILAIVILTTLNIFSIIVGSFGYFLFSANIPYSIVNNFAYETGRYPAEYYEAVEEFEFLPDTFFWGAVAVAALIIVAYLLCFIFSKKKSGWMIAALVLFSIDTADLLYNMLGYLLNGTFMLSDVPDIVFHGLALAMLIEGVVLSDKIKMLKAEPDPAEPNQNGEFSDSYYGERINFDTQPDNSGDFYDYSDNNKNGGDNK